MYSIEKVIRKFNDEEREVKFLSGVGNLTKDIESRVVTTKNGDIAVAGGYNQSIAFNYWKDGEKKAAYFPIEAWDKTAELLAKFGKKGTELVVHGRIEERRSLNKETGQEYINEVLVIERFQMTSRNKSNDKHETVGIEGFSPADGDDIPF